MKRLPSMRYYTITEAAKKLGVTRAAVHRAIMQHRLEAEWGVVGLPPKGWRISQTNLSAYDVSAFHQEAGKKISNV